MARLFANQEEQAAAVAAIKGMYPSIDWDRFEDMDRALNAELWHGPLPADYWTEADPLEHYTWRGWEQAQEDLQEILAPLPAELYWDADSECIVTSNPEDDHENWLRVDQDTGEEATDDTDERDVEYVWVGGEWTIINPRQVLMWEETYRQVF